MIPIQRRSEVLSFTAVGAVVLALTACGADRSSDAQGSSSAKPSKDAAEPSKEVSGTRLAVTYDGGVLVIDRMSLKPVGDLKAEGFLRVNPAGDGRHVLLSEAGGFRVIDTGVRVRAHGDHVHYYGQDPQLTDTVYKAEEPGHAVVHHDQVALFDDGTGQVRTLPAPKIADGGTGREWKAPHAHHGVAVPIDADSMLVTIGDEETRSGAQILKNGKAVATSEDCPEVHGEASTGKGTLAVGCENGALLWKGGAFTKVASPNTYGRIGTMIRAEKSEVLLGDYKFDKDAELENPTRVSLLDTTTQKLSLVELGASYSWRSLERGPNGEGLVLGTDGALHVIDPTTGKVTAKHPVVKPWKEPADWQVARPTIRVVGQHAYVSEPATKQLRMVDLTDGEIIESVTLPHEPNEISTV